MAFIRAASPRYFAPASFQTLDNDGRLLTNLFDCEFKRLKLSELKKLQQRVNEWSAEILRNLNARAEAIRAASEKARKEDKPLELPEEDSAPLQDLVNRRLLAEVMTGWRAVQAPDGSDLPFSLESVDMTEEEFPGFINSCASAFWKSCQPKEAAHLAAKN